MDFLGLGLLLTTGLLVGIALLSAYTARMLTRPPRRGFAFAVARSLPADPGELRFVDSAGGERIGAPFESWTFRSRGVDLPVWDIAGLDPLGAVIILTHGWGDSRVVSLCRAPSLLRHARRLILWDMPGHGEAPGRCTLGQREADDLIALVEAVREPGVVLYGHSMGAGVCIEAAARLGDQRVGAVIAEAPYAVPPTPARNVLRAARLPYRFNLPLALAFIRPRFDRVQQAAGLRASLLVLHGGADAVCPLDDARRIAAHAPDATLRIIEEGGHLNLYTEPELLRSTEECLAAFLAALPRRAATPA